FEHTKIELSGVVIGNPVSCVGMVWFSRWLAAQREATKDNPEFPGSSDQSPRESPLRTCGSFRRLLHSCESPQPAARTGGCAPAWPQAARRFQSWLTTSTIP